MRRASLVLALALVAGCAEPDPDPPTGAVDAARELPVLPDFGPPPVPDAGAEVLTDPGPCEGLAEGAPCDDGDACTQGETCQGGFCVAASVVTCPPPTEPCRTAVCDAALGCQEIQAGDGATCDVSCYDEAQCLGGECLPVAGAEVQCPAPTDPCVDSVACDPGTNTCSLLLYKLACPAGSVCREDEGVLECVPAFDSLCRPCLEHDECADPALPSQINACVPRGPAGSFCGGDCANLPCPGGYECVPVDGPMGERSQCLPEGSVGCACDPSWAAMQLTTACYAENDFGVCEGQRGCAPGGLTPCDAPAPEAEVCDGVDNDCDAATDEDLSCGEPGACCLGDGGCEVRYEQSCLLSGGVYQGTGLACTEVACAGGEGACCRPDGSCTVQSLDVCASIGGSYAGDGTLCTTSGCQAEPDPGACCFFTGACEFQPPLSCTTGGGVFAGKGTDCTQAVCDSLGACCLPTLSCVNTSQPKCEVQGGEYTANVACSDKPCLLGEGYGACCLGAGACEVVTEDGCPGQFLLAEPCLGQCDIPDLGACCAPLGECTLVPEGQCASPSTFEGVGSQCPSACAAPDGACCGPGKQCLAATQAECALFGNWLWLGEGVTCPPDKDCWQPP